MQHIIFVSRRNFVAGLDESSIAQPLIMTPREAERNASRNAQDCCRELSFRKFPAMQNPVQSDVHPRLGCNHARKVQCNRMRQSFNAVAAGQMTPFCSSCTSEWHIEVAGRGYFKVHVQSSLTCESIAPGRAFIKNNKILFRTYLLV